MEFLYKDTEVINSIYSQVFGGDLQGVSQLASTSEECNLDGGINVGFAKTSALTKDIVTEQLVKNIISKDEKIIDLFSELNIKEYTKSLNNCKSGRIVKLDADISFRNLDTFKNMLPLLKELGYIPDIFNDNDSDKVKDLFVDFISKSFPKGLEFELITICSHEKVNCSINENFLINDNNALIKSYTSKYLGKWTIIGIFDNILPKINECTSTNYNFKSSIDQVEQSIFEIINPNDSNKFVLKPIIIYRTLNY
jgi:hypothetical protein